ncbi:MAG: CHAT domain-containing protein, partial [Planctomycetaceae bacterium]|nr:CHAT domain-containing protein [Planctomycetaceae bacterium]
SLSREPATAEKSLREAVDVLTTNGQPQVVADAMKELASVLSEQGKYAEAKPYLKNALKIYAEHEPKGLSCIDCQMRLAEWHLMQDQLPDAEKVYRQSLTLAREVLGEENQIAFVIEGMLATLSGEQGRLKEALSIQQPLVETVRRRFGKYAVTTARAGMILAAIHHKNSDYKTAQTVSEEAFQIDLQIAGNVLPVVSEAEGIEFIQQVYSDRDFVLASMRRIKPLDAEHAYELVSKSRGLVSQFSERYEQVSLDDEQAKALMEKLQTKRFELARVFLSDKASVEKVNALTQEKETIQRSLRRRASELGVRLPNHEEDRDLYSRLTEKMALVEFLKSTLPDNQGYLYDAFIVRRDANQKKCHVEWVQLGEAAPIERAVRGWRYSILKPRGGTVIPPDLPIQSAEDILRKRVWLKLEPHLQGIKHIVIVPDAALARVPWGALRDHTPQNVLLERYSFSTITGNHRLNHFSQPKPRRKPGNLLLVGGVYYGEGSDRSSPDFAYLPGTAKEIEGVAKVAPSDWQRVRLTKEQATVETVTAQLGKADHVLLATHGFSKDQQGWGGVVREPRSVAQARRWLTGIYPVRPGVRSPLALSGLVLHPAKRAQAKDDLSDVFPTNRLSGEMIAQLDLRGLQLVVLSACESGLGDVSGGEGVFGLQRAFEIAGADTTVASLWNVPDEATTQLMVRFFENRWKRGMGSLEALRESQLWLRSSEAGKTLPPYYWGAFMLSGDWR